MYVMKKIQKYVACECQNFIFKWVNISCWKAKRRRQLVHCETRRELRSARKKCRRHMHTMLRRLATLTLSSGESVTTNAVCLSPHSSVWTALCEPWAPHQVLHSLLKVQLLCFIIPNKVECTQPLCPTALLKVITTFWAERRSTGTAVTEIIAINSRAASLKVDDPPWSPHHTHTHNPQSDPII